MSINIDITTNTVSIQEGQEVTVVVTPTSSSAQVVEIVTAGPKGEPGIGIQGPPGELPTSGSFPFSGSINLTGSLQIIGDGVINGSIIVSSNTVLKVEAITSASYAQLNPPVSGTLYIIID